MCRIKLFFSENSYVTIHSFLFDLLYYFSKRISLNMYSFVLSESTYTRLKHFFDRILNIFHMQNPFFLYEWKCVSINSVWFWTRGTHEIFTLHVSVWTEFISAIVFEHTSQKLDLHSLNDLSVWTLSNIPRTLNPLDHWVFSKYSP